MGRPPRGSLGRDGIDSGQRLLRVRDAQERTLLRNEECGTR
jgi:hypothetical protein